MIAVIMAGGKGTRMNSDIEKLLLKYKKPIILHVVDALKESQCFDEIFAATSPNSPKTKELLENEKIKTIETKGEGYVIDLNFVLKSLEDDVFVTSGDLPLLDGEIINQIVSKYDPQNAWTSIVLTKEFLESLNIEAEFPVKKNENQCYYSGVSLINSKKISSLESVKEHLEILDDKRIAFNLNTKNDCELIGVS